MGTCILCMYGKLYMSFSPHALSRSIYVEVGSDLFLSQQSCACIHLLADAIQQSTRSATVWKLKPDKTSYPYNNNI